VKLFRNLPGIRFEGRIHEQVLIPIRRAGGTVAWTDVFVVHANADQSPEGRAKKIARDLRILELDRQERPNHPFVLFNLGMTLAEAGRLKQEHGDETRFEQKVTKETKGDDVVPFVAFCADSSAECFQRAIEFLWQSIGLAGDDESHLRKAFAILVSSYRQLGRHVTAWETCVKGLKRFPDDVELRFRQAVMLRDVGNLPDAARAFEDLLAMGNGDAKKESENGDRHDLPGRPCGCCAQIEPVPVFRRHLSSVDGGLKGFRTRQNLAEVYASLGEFTKADAEWRRVVAEVPDDPAFRERHCRLLFEHFEPAAAEPAFRELIASDPQNAAAHQNLGSILYKLGRFEESAAAYRESLRHRPGFAWTCLHLGYALRESGKLDEAITVWEEALRAEPADAAVSRELQQLIASRGGGIKQAG
jgi:tetratricopeptide (TPR) repeat protein